MPVFANIAAFTYGKDDWELVFYGKAIKEVVDVANQLTRVRVRVIENALAKHQTCTRERPLVGDV